MKAKSTTSGGAAGLTLTSRIHFRRAARGRLELAAGPKPVENAGPATAGRVPKVARLMALAIKLQGMLDRGEAKDYAELARLGHVTRARLTQVMNLTLLAPDLQEALLFLPPTAAGRDAVKEWQVRPVVAELLWAEQRRAWRRLPHPDAGSTRTGRGVERTDLSAVMPARAAPAGCRPPRRC
ncbi:MAG TPA: hypothetical protein VF796_16485 [Humisphaera sp.]